ncbi:GNAT family N-acetyltransferase [Candidatus Clostridium radicumherbarum]|uniref:GNAT family N-acetyltransferase n=1 Tax=Candidatus Clostridium radicumherbarum TaxID=3381662 RepID=A0ABW8TWW7_9CLOT
MRINGEQIYIRYLNVLDTEAVLHLHLRNKEFFRKYSSTKNEDFYTLKIQEDIIKDNELKCEKDEKYSFGIFTKNSDELIGNIALTEVLRGSLQSCYIGYFLDMQHNGKGYMTESVKLVVKFAFEDLRLHRIEAGVMPHNIRSMCVLENAGFKKEGIARKNVNINGVWQDHQVLAIIWEDYNK